MTMKRIKIENMLKWRESRGFAYYFMAGDLAGCEDGESFGWTDGDLKACAAGDLPF
jgi:hypothetical protein